MVLNHRTITSEEWRHQLFKLKKEHDQLWTLSKPLLLDIFEEKIKVPLITTETPGGLITAYHFDEMRLQLTELEDSRFELALFVQDQLEYKLVLTRYPKLIGPFAIDLHRRDCVEKRGYPTIVPRRPNMESHGGKSSKGSVDQVLIVEGP